MFSSSLMITSMLSSCLMLTPNVKDQAIVQPDDNINVIIKAVDTAYVKDNVNIQTDENIYVFI
jgi:hypothetical protein